ncbi:hypothetical protein [Ferrovum sp.]|uniref:hypothetical protein n=1 Tax=Ferrovum sp. TaxID=2609467 RepID=UPI00260AC8C2|nr:hypothetical protein [Ferrovum sp.]
MSAVATAIVGGSVLGGLITSQGAQSAASTQAGAATQNQQAVLDAGKQASGLDLGAIGQANAYLQPYANLGSQSASQLQNLLTGAGNGNAMQALQNMPGYQFQLQQGLESTQNGFAAKGLGSSGAAMKGAANYVNGLTASNLSNFYNMLMGGTQVGANAASVQAQNTSNLTTAGANALMGGSTNAASLGMAGAAASAAGQVGAANALGSGIANAANGYGQYTLMNNMLTNPGMYAAGMYDSAQAANQAATLMAPGYILPLAN